MGVPMKKRLSLMLALSFSSMAFASKTSVRGVFPHERSSNKSMFNATTGRYMYLGNAIKAAKAEDIEITISKMSLTNRITVWITQNEIDTFASKLFSRWKTIHDAIESEKIRFHPLVKLETLNTANSLNNEAWNTIAG